MLHFREIQVKEGYCFSASLVGLKSCPMIEALAWGRGVAARLASPAFVSLVASSFGDDHSLSIVSATAMRECRAEQQQGHRQYGMVPDSTLAHLKACQQQLTLVCVWQSCTSCRILYTLHPSTAQWAFVFVVTQLSSKTDYTAKAISSTTVDQQDHFKP